MGSLLWKLLVGGITGLVVWMVLEPLAPAASGGENWAAWELKLVLVLGAATGLTVGALNGFIQGSKLHLFRSAALGLVFGAVGAPLGYQIGGQITNALFPSTVFVDPTISIATKTIARVIALTPIGLFLGAAIGASSLNAQRFLQGAIGGLIGAAIGGALFDTVGAITAPMNIALQGVKGGATAETGSLSRALYAVLMAGLIALFIGIIDLIARTAWVRLQLGRNEGKEWVIDAPQNFIGRDERAQVPLFGDPNVAPMHACILRQGKGQYVLADGGSPAGTYLNGQRISQAPLTHGSQINIGSFCLIFMMKHGAAPDRGPEVYAQAYPVGGTMASQHSVGVASMPAPGALYNSTAATPPPNYAPQPSQATAAYSPSQMGQPVSYALSALDGPLAGQRFPVRQTLEIGRDTLGIPMSYDSNASRRHASVAPSAYGLVVNDLGSTNGTFVNGQRVQMANVSPNDTIKIGSTTFRVEVG